MCRRGAPLRCDAVLRRRCEPDAGLEARPLTPPVAPRQRPHKAVVQGARTASVAPSSKSAASTARGAFHRQVLPDRPLARGQGTRHRARGLCRGAGFRRRSPPQLSPERAVPPRARSARPQVRAVKRRLSTSAITTVPEHDHGIAETPATSPRRVTPCAAPMQAGCSFRCSAG